MHFQWKCFCKKNNIQPALPSGPESSCNPGQFSSWKELRRGSTSFWSSVYDKAVRTESYNEFMMKMEGLASQFPLYHNSNEFEITMETDGLLQPNQETVASVLRESSENERPEIMKLAMAFFDINWQASRLCGALLHSIHEVRAQCRQMEMMLSKMPPWTSEVLSALQQTQMEEGLCEMTGARNPFAEGGEMIRMFMDVRESYSVLSEDVDKRRRLIESKVRVFKMWKRGCIVGTVVAGAAVIAIVVATQVVASAAAVPVMAVVAAVHARKVRRVHCPIRCEGKKGKGRWGWRRIGGLRRQRAKLEAVARGSFTVRRMVDTLRCLVVGLQEDVERKRRLVEFGWAHHHEIVCLVQIATQLRRSHLHLTQQLDNLEEQVIVCFLIINKARDWVFQEFSPTPSSSSSSSSSYYY